MKKIYYTAAEVAEMLGVSRATAYEIVKKLNEELENLGYIVVKGKVAKAYFHTKIYGMAEAMETKGA